MTRWLVRPSAWRRLLAGIGSDDAATLAEDLFGVTGALARQPEPAPGAHRPVA